jgi:KDO2-lipid IV(A) lauroyltransferase
LLPLSIIYVFTDIVFIIFCTIFPYRKKVIIENLSKSFPTKSTKEISLIQRKFYRHFCDLLAEGIKNLSISKNELLKRIKVENPLIMDQLFKQNKSVILVAGHYNNWEFLISAQHLLFKHAAFGIGKKMTNAFMDNKINERRMRYGMHVIHKGNFKEEIEKVLPSPIAILTLTDQSPSDTHKSYWMEFLNQQTPVLFGAEQMAHSYDFAVVYFETKKLKRGHYSIDLKLITDQPKSLEWGEITEAHTKSLESTIIKKPEFWLWSHRRWKRTLPEDMNHLKEQQNEKFNERFKR